MGSVKNTVKAQAAMGHDKHELNRQSQRTRKVDKIQPWKDIIEQIESEIMMMPLEGDFFVCLDSLHAQSLAAQETSPTTLVRVSTC